MNLPLLPGYARKKVNLSSLRSIKLLLRKGGLHTVCEESRCPNIRECFRASTATFMILGNRCTRLCGFCGVGKGMPDSVNPSEPDRIAGVAEALKLKYAIVTSVTRDDLEDGGAMQFYLATGAIKRRVPDAVVELLTPDFKGKEELLEIICRSDMDVFGHNMETVNRLYPYVRPGADYRRSLNILKFVHKQRQNVIIKSGFMLGIGEKENEVKILLEDLLEAGCKVITIGQYLRPSLECIPVQRYLVPEEFAQLKKTGEEMGFIRVVAGPFVRSSYRSESYFRELKIN